MNKENILVYVDGKNVPYFEANIHILSPAVKYGFNVFEGLRGYWNEEKEEVYIFRLWEHLVRLEQSAKIASMKLPISLEEIEEALVNLIRENDYKSDLHIRIMLYVDGDNGYVDSQDEFGLFMAAIPMGRFVEEEDKLLDIGVSHWQRIPDTVMPARVKAGANYLNGRLALIQAKNSGYDDVIQMDINGKVSEGPGQNFFLVRNGHLITSPVTGSILEGITRETLTYLAKEELDIPVEHREVDKSELYIADEAFFCGSAVEVTPVGSIDGFKINNGKKGEITMKLAETYFNVVQGRNDKFKHWLTPVFSK